MRNGILIAIKTVGLTALSFVGLLDNVQATPPEPETRPAHPIKLNVQKPPFLESGSSQKSSRYRMAPTNMVPWSKLVFESYRDGNWEVYLADGDGTNQIRLTDDDELDIHPFLNRGCTSIVFTNDRTGNDFELFTMNTDGTGLFRLTRDSTDDVYPVWSPDGTKIAFQSYRDGQAEIYVMNKDGSSQKRLTFDDDYDGMPAWSPDGEQIAFVSRRTGGYRIYLMNADGSNVRQLSNQPYSESPTWSPDGEMIVYDSDANQDGWQELWLMNADGSGQHQIYDPPEYQTDAYPRSWSPDGRYIGFTRISFVNYDGNWYWTEAYMDAGKWKAFPQGVVHLP